MASMVAMAKQLLHVSIGVSALFLAVGFFSASAALASPSGLEWNPPSYDFGPVTYGTGPSESKEFTLTNTSASRVVIQNWRYEFVVPWPEASDPFGSPHETATPCLAHGDSMEPGESCSVDLDFEPLHPGNWWRKIRVRLEGEEEWTELTVSGEGVGPWVPLTPSSLAFGAVAVGVASAPQTVVVENQDPTELRIEGISIIGRAGLPSPGPFRIVGGTCQIGGSLKPGKTCTIEVLTAPTHPGLFQAGLEVTDSAPDSPQSVTLESSSPEPPPSDQPASPEGDVTVAPPTTTAPSAKAISPSRGPRRRACPKGKRRIARKGHQICVKRGVPRRNRHADQHNR